MSLLYHMRAKSQQHGYSGLSALPVENRQYLRRVALEPLLDTLDAFGDFVGLEHTFPQDGLGDSLDVRPFFGHELTRFAPQGIELLKALRGIRLDRSAAIFLGRG
jgi:hypothetical protein